MVVVDKLEDFIKKNRQLLESINYIILGILICDASSFSELPLSTDSAYGAFKFVKITKQCNLFKPALDHNEISQQV